MKKIVLFLFILFTFIPLYSQESGKFDWDRPMLGKKAPILHLKEWLTERPDTTGKFIILDFWATFCGPCVNFTPRMNKFAKKFKKDAVFIAIATQLKEDVEKGIRDIQKMKKKYVPIKFYQATDPGYELYSAYQGVGIPMVLIIDPTGFVRWQGNPHGENGKEGLTVKVIKGIIRKYKKR